MVIFSIWENHKTIAYNPLPKESKIFCPLFVKDAAIAIDKIIKNKIFQGKIFELYGPKSYSWEELMRFFKKTLRVRCF